MEMVQVEDGKGGAMFAEFTAGALGTRRREGEDGEEMG
jgi:hypothetical protein